MSKTEINRNPVNDELLLPFIEDENAPFWDGCREGVLRIQQCPDTKRLIFPPRPFSPWSMGARPVWTEVSGKGTIWSFIEPHPPLMLNFAELAPYNVIVVTLDEDPSIRLVGNLLAKEGGAINELGYDDVVIGTSVRVVFDKLTDEVTLPRWIAID